MAHLNLRVDDHTRDLLDALARARGDTPSGLIRELINGALGLLQDSDRPRDDTTPRSMSAIERRSLAMQHEGLAHLTQTEEADGGWESQYHRDMVEVLSRGYTAEYYKTFQMIQREMTDRECDLVHDILEMFMQVERSVGELTDEERASLGDHYEFALRFRGFDFNDSQESRLASYARYVIEDGRWEFLADRFDNQHERGNSHSPALATYQRMLSAFRPIWKTKVESYGGRNEYLLSAEELSQIIAAWPYPRD
jgi:uncharacterized protein YfbU (UPF0304 family)